jgi:hypothetical protein
MWIPVQSPQGRLEAIEPVSSLGSVHARDIDRRSAGEHGAVPYEMPSFIASGGRRSGLGQSAASLGVDQVQEVADAHVALQKGTFGGNDGALAVLLRQFVHACNRVGIEPKSQQRLRSLRRHPGVGFDDLVQYFTFRIK